jgi:signal transduction histidine kinase
MRRLSDAARRLGQTVSPSAGVGIAVAPPQLDEERGTREVRETARVFNELSRQLKSDFDTQRLMLATISHDLRTPLTRLRAQLYRLQTETDRADARRPMLEQCIVDTDALLDRFRALLRISELEDLRRRAGFAGVDIADALRQVHELYTPVAEDKGVKLELSVKDTAPINADAHLLIEALSNLVANAIKFTPAQGTVELRAERTPNGTRIDVLDNGPGIPTAERGAVLRRFYRSESGREAPGFGLGLSIVAAIMRLHDFRLEISDNSPRGARLTIYCWPQGGQSPA